jgi:hypothetical protein
MATDVLAYFGKVRIAAEIIIFYFGHVELKNVKGL